MSRKETKESWQNLGLQGLLNVPHETQGGIVTDREVSELGPTPQEVQGQPESTRIPASRRSQRVPFHCNESAGRTHGPDVQVHWSFRGRQGTEIVQ